MFKVGDTIKCVDAGPNEYITNGKNYLVVETFVSALTDGVRIRADYGTENSYFSRRFELVRDEPAPTARANDPATSKGKRKVNKYEQAVLTYLGRTAGGATGKDLAEWSGHPLNCITPRFAPLRRKGLIKALKVEVGRGVGQVVKRDKQIVWVLA